MAAPKRDRVRNADGDKAKVRTLTLSKDLQRSLTVFVSACLIFSMLAYIAVTPRPKEQFFQFYALDESRTVEHYYPKDNPTIPLDTSVKWFLGVTNFMNSIQYVAIKVKLGNSTLAPPDETQAKPAPIPVLFEFRKVLTNNETWEFPFTWSIKEVQVVGNMIQVTHLTINDETIIVSNIGAEHGYNLRLILELWSFNRDEDRFIFGWYASQERKCAWLQLWFNVTSPI